MMALWIECYGSTWGPRLMWLSAIGVVAAVVLIVVGLSVK